MMNDIVRFDGEGFALGFNQILRWRSVGAVEAGSVDLLRKIVFYKPACIVFNAECLVGSDDVHSRQGGWNEQLLRKARERNIIVGFSFSDFLRVKEGTERARIFGRMLQNVRFCRKFHVRMVVASCARTKWEQRNAADLLSFARVLGMTGSEARDALSFSP